MDCVDYTHEEKSLPNKTNPPHTNGKVGDVQHTHILTGGNLIKGQIQKRTVNGSMSFTLKVYDITGQYKLETRHDKLRSLSIIDKDNHKRNTILQGTRESVNQQDIQSWVEDCQNIYLLKSVNQNT